MQDGSGSAMIALLPIVSDWCKIDLPHLTLVYAGMLTDLKPEDYTNLLRDASALAIISNPLTLRVGATAVFGDNTPDNPQVNVLKFVSTPELSSMRTFVEKWNASQFPFNPHATIGPVDGLPIMNVPSFVAFNRIMVGWGTDSMTFNLARPNF